MAGIGDINRLRIFNRLKSVYRASSVDKRKESSAEHSWSCLVLADFFLSLHNLPLDRLKVYELLLYHDVVEIEAGDSPLCPKIKVEGKEEKEKKAAAYLQKSLPEPLGDKFSELFREFEEGTTRESRFAKAIDALDPILHELDYKSDWKGWSEEFLIEKKLGYFEEFPELKETFYALLTFMKEEGYFEQ